MSNLDRARNLVAEVLRVPPERIEPETQLNDVAQLDSLSLVEIASALDEEFDIRVPSDDLGSAKSLNDILAIVERSPAR
ncbi:MAG: acyl carrier protein [Candidatus Binatia bacterium]|nr:acyl carrier protein [Candidatus Binatia bacterium]